MTDYRIIADTTDEHGEAESLVIAHRGDLFSALCVYLDAELDHPGCHVYLQEQEPETMVNRGYLTIRSSRIAA